MSDVNFTIPRRRQESRIGAERDGINSAKCIGKNRFGQISLGEIDARQCYAA